MAFFLRHRLAKGLAPDARSLGDPVSGVRQHPVSLPIWLYVCFAVLFVVVISDTVNLTDGLDGLAIGPVMMSAGTYLIWAYIAGSVLFGRRSRNTSTSPASQR